MKVSVFGLGYVGCVTAACLSQDGHQVIGVDINEMKIGMINEGKSPIVEKGLEDLIRSGRQQGTLQATTDLPGAVMDSDVSLVCVGTPSCSNGSLDLHTVKTISRELGNALRGKNKYHCFVFRSTVLPGTIRQTVIPLLEKWSGKTAHEDFDVCFNPEFLREGSSIKDFYNPPFTVIGANTSRGTDVVASLSEAIGAPIERTTFEVAEMVKYVCNAFHALKVTFANEIGNLCKALHMDSHQVMSMVCQDTKLNISSAYLKPGFAFGGSCLPKDLRAILYQGKELDLVSPLLSSLMESNRLHVQGAVNRVIGKGKKKVGILGLSFKEGTDDLRESPTVALVENLIGKGFQVKIYDPEVSLSKIFGANKEYIEKEIPHISVLVSDNLVEVIQASEVLVIAKSFGRFSTDIQPYLRDKVILDLVRVSADLTGMPPGYEGICW
jgi:GDP-mannose 6-dehydrogenase